MPRTFDEAMAAAVKWKDNAEARDIVLARMTQAEEFPVLLSLIVEFRDDLTRAVSSYDRSQDERNLDAGGLATANKMLDIIQGAMHPPVKEPEIKQEK